MKKLIIIIAVLLSFTAKAQLTPEQKKDPMRPKGMIEVGAEGYYSESHPDGLNYSIRYYLKVGNKSFLVGVRYWLYGANTYKYYWIPKYCKCSQEYIKVNE